MCWVTIAGWWRMWVQLGDVCGWGNIFGCSLWVGWHLWVGWQLRVLQPSNTLKWLSAIFSRQNFFRFQLQKLRNYLIDSFTSRLHILDYKILFHTLWLALLWVLYPEEVFSFSLLNYCSLRVIPGRSHANVVPAYFDIVHWYDRRGWSWFPVFFIS